MTKRIFLTLLATVLAMSMLSLAQENVGAVKGSVIGTDNKPIPDAVVRLTSPDGKKIDIKTDQDGKFLQTGVPAGSYKVQMLVKNEPKFEGSEPVVVTAGQIATLPINLATIEQMQKMTPEERKAREEQGKKAEAERGKIKNLNAMITQARQADKDGNFDQAISLMQQATQTDPTKDLLWYELGSAYLGKSAKTADKTESASIAGQAVAAFQKAIEIKPNDAPYHNNLGQAYSRMGKSDDALKEYTQAGSLDPVDAAMYYFNAGATLTNVSTKAAPGSADQKQKLDAANEMFKKSAAADPKYKNGEAYYQLGSNLFNQATMSKDGKVVVPEGTAEAYQKYLEVSPNGPYAEAAKGALSAMGSSVQTTYKSGKKK